MKYMTFNNSCSYAGVANMLEDFNIDVPEWHELYKSGQKKTCQYIVRLAK